MKRDAASAMVSLDDKYTVLGGRAFLTGIQALVRLPMLQKLRDEAAGLNTAGFVSGYRGSPLGGLDLQLWKAREHLERHHIVFQPGVNEDLAATAVWGTQQVGLFPGAKHDGVFALWYGKGPGVDRCGDVFRHANAAGTARHGGVLVIAGDDHAAKSSTLPHQTEHVFKAVMMPVLAPANTQEYLDYGLHGWAMSRYSGCWVAFKALADTVETSASVLVDPFAVEIKLPTDFPLPEDGLNIRWPDPPLVQEARLLHHKLYAALAYCRANRLNRTVIDTPPGVTPRLGIVTCGKSYLDVRQAFDELGIDDELAARIGIRLYKVGMVWPLESEGVRHFAEGLEEILVVEEKRQLLEYQLKEELYNWREDVRPRVIGKFDEKGEWAMIPQAGADGKICVDHGEWLLPAAGELSVARIASVIAGRIERFFTSPRIRERLAIIEGKQRALAQPLALATRTPFFCSGCPHNTSTRVPEGSRAVAGIGCHYMVTWMDRGTATFTHMGGEGVPWVGQAPFTETKHIFANLGDGTYFHSGLLAIRQAIAAGVNITYKILYNDAVAMTGGQPLDGTLTVPDLTRQLEAEGVEKIVIVTDEPQKYHGVIGLAPDTRIHHRDELDVVQRQLREIAGCTILIYDQTCATEKRRRRKRGKLVDPPRRVFINELVCEGCGDCSKESNCLSVLPVETEFGRKRVIDQSSCNKDFSCLRGFCPSFVTIEGGGLRRGAAAGDEVSLPQLPEPVLPALTQPWSMLVTGVGGTGVVTLGALVGMAAHLDGLGITVLDMTGLAQKYGAVYSHLRIAARPDDLHAVRIATGEADAVLGGDLIVSAGSEALSKMLAGRTRAVINCTDTPTAEFTRDPEWRAPTARLREQIAEALGHRDETPRVWFLDAQSLATAAMGDAVFANLLLLGVAWQRGLVPVSRQSLLKAIEMNGVAVAANTRAFEWGRRLATDPATATRLTAAETSSQGIDAHRLSRTLDDVIARRVEYLSAYQNAAYAGRYRGLVDEIRQAETPYGETTLSDLVARQYFRVLAIKDEYEVARLHTAPEFLREIDARFTGNYRLQFHFAPPWWARPDPATGRIQKRPYGHWMLHALRVIAAFKGLRGGPFDLFGKTAERRGERALIGEYETDVIAIVKCLQGGGATRAQRDAAAHLAAWPSTVRGYGHVKAASLAEVRRALPGWRLALSAAAAECSSG